MVNQQMLLNKYLCHGNEFRLGVRTMPDPLSLPPSNSPSIMKDHEFQKFITEHLILVNRSPLPSSNSPTQETRTTDAAVEEGVEGNTVVEENADGGVTLVKGEKLESRLV
jgi:hypothetical protein